MNEPSPVRICDTCRRPACPGERFCPACRAAIKANLKPLFIPIPPTPYRGPESREATRDTKFGVDR